MTTKRKSWRAPALMTKSVREVLGPGETAGPMAPGLVAGHNPMFGPAEPVAGSSGRDCALIGPDAVTVGPPTRSAISGPPGTAQASSGPRGPSPAPVFGPPDRLFFLGPAGGVPASYGPPVFRPSDGPPVQPSDIRLKEDVTAVGSSAQGLPLYTFRYRGKEGLYQGVMAQDVLKARPDAVMVDADGFYMVDYGKLGIEFRRIQ